MTHTHEGRLPLFFQSNFVGKGATLSRGRCHQSRVAWQQNGPKLDRRVCVHALLRPSESQTQSQLGSPIPGPSSSQAELLERWSFGKEGKVPGIPSGNLGFSFQSTPCAKKPAKLQNAIYPPEWPEDEFEGRGLYCKLGIGLCLKNSALLNPASARGASKAGSH